MYRFVRGAGNDVLLCQRLQTVRQRLKQPIRSHSIWAVTVLESAQSLALKDRCYRNQGGKHRDNRHAEKHRRKDGLHFNRQVGHEPVLQYDKDLIHHFSHGVQLVWDPALVCKMGDAEDFASAAALALASALTFASVSRSSTSAAPTGWIMWK